MANLDLKNIHDWPLPTRIVAIGLLCGIVFYLGYMLDLSDVQRRLRGNKQIETDLKQQVIMTINKEKEIQNSLNKSAGLAAALLEWQKKLIDYRQLPEVLNNILKTGANNQLEFNLFNPGARTQEESYFKTPIKIVATGTYHQIASFISQIANMPWLIEVEDFSIGRENKEVTLGVKLGSNPETLLLTLTLDIYYLPEKP